MKVYDGAYSAKRLVGYLKNYEYLGEKIGDFLIFSKKGKTIYVWPDDGVGLRYSIIRKNNYKVEMRKGWLITHMLGDDYELSSFEIGKKDELAYELIGMYLEETPNGVRVKLLEKIKNDKKGGK